MTLAAGPIRLKRRTTDADLVLSVTQQYEIVDCEAGYRVHTLEYSYKIDNWSDGHEVMAYHWHPRTWVKYPHLHLSYGALVRDDLAKAHVPTGRIALEDVVEFLIESLKVVPAREDWESALEETRSLFKKFRTWA